MTRRFCLFAVALHACSAHQPAPDIDDVRSANAVPSDVIRQALACQSQIQPCPTAQWLVVFEGGDGDEVLDLPVSGRRELTRPDGTLLRIATSDELRRLVEQTETTEAIQLFVLERTSRLLRGELRGVAVGKGAISYDFCSRVAVDVEKVGSEWRCVP